MIVPTSVAIGRYLCNQVLDIKLAANTADIDLISQVDLISKVDYKIEHISSSVCFEIYPTARPAFTTTDLFVGLAKKQEPFFLSVGYLIATSCKLAISIFCRGKYKINTLIAYGRMH